MLIELDYLKLISRYSFMRNKDEIFKVLTRKGLLVSVAKSKSFR